MLNEPNRTSVDRTGKVIHLTEASYRNSPTVQSQHIEFNSFPDFYNIVPFSSKIDVEYVHLYLC